MRDAGVLTRLIWGPDGWLMGGADLDALLGKIIAYLRRIEPEAGTPNSRHSRPRFGWPKGVGFCRSGGLAAAFDDVAVHEAGNGHN